MPHAKDPLKDGQGNHPVWNLSSEQVLALFKTRAEGLSQKEYEERLHIFGQNLIRQKQGNTKLQLFIEQLKSPLILILIVAAVIMAGLNEWLDMAVILAAVCVNAVLGFWQENKAQTILEHLSSYIRVRARVKRDGQEHEIDAADLVPGDVIRVNQGDRIPADARLLFANTLMVDESVLTGESLPVEKTTAPCPLESSLAERTCLVYGGTLVVEGFGDAVIVSTDEHTEFGKIAVLASHRQAEPTPLQKAVSKFASQLGFIVIVVTIALFAVGLWLHHNPVEMFLIAVSVAVSVVPEGLPIALTIILAIGVERLGKKRGVIRKLVAAEALGSTTLILTDKTGTLTQARMTLTDVLPWQKGVAAKKQLLADALLNTDVVIENPQASPSEWRLVGRPMEVALVRGASEADVFYSQRFEKAQIIERLPFHSRYKYSMSLVTQGTDSFIVLAGAPEIITSFMDFDDKERAELLHTIQTRAETGERLLGIGRKTVSAQHLLHAEEPPSGFTFEGLLAFRDPVRPHVKDAIARIGASGVRTIMITGDHPGTATMIGRELGMFTGQGKTLTGDDLRRLDPVMLAAEAPSVSVYARVTPEQKLDIVHLYQKLGEVVAVTGDGVNDAPALEAADIGVAVGSGTDVAKSAADLVILDDDFETIVLAIEEGRRILGNIRKVLVYLLSNTIDSVLLIGGALVLGLALPLNPLQILFVNFFSDSFPAIAFAFEPQTDTHSIRGKQHKLFDTEMRVLVFILGASSSVLLFGLYILLLRLGYPQALVHTFTFAAFATYSLFMSFALRSLKRSIFSYNPFGNYFLTGGVAIGVFLTVAAVYVPWLQVALHTVALPLPWLLGVFGVGIVNVAGVEGVKWLVRKNIIVG